MHDYGYKYETLLMVKKKLSPRRIKSGWIKLFRDININVNGFYVFNQLSYYALRLQDLLLGTDIGKETHNLYNIGMEKTLKDFVPIEEGVNDPAIFTVFLAALVLVNPLLLVKLLLTAFGYKVVNSDNAFEMRLKKAGMEMTADNIFSCQGSVT